MYVRKITLDDDAIEYISYLDKYEQISSVDAINLWSCKQELEKNLKVGDIVKINTGKGYEFNCKKGFIGDVLIPVGFGNNPRISGRFAVYFLNYKDNNFEGNFQGYELEPTGDTVDPYFLREFITKIKPTDPLYKEILQCMMII